jgi:HEAT repeat protein
MLTELFLTSLIIGSIEGNSSLTFPRISDSDLETRTVLSKDYKIKNLTERLNDANPTVRVSAISQIAETSLKSALPLLIEALKDNDFRVRGTAAIYLGKANDSRPIPYLINLLNDDNHEVKGSAALSLGRLKATEAVNALIQCLNDKQLSVKLSASYSLGIIGSTKAVQPLIKLLNDDNAQVRETTVWSLGTLKAREALPYLQLLLQDTDPLVRASTRKAIVFIKYSMIADTSGIKYSGGEGKDFNDAIVITGIRNPFACLQSQKEYINRIYGEEIYWKQVDKTHIKYNNKHYDLITVKENNSGNYRKFYFDITEFFSQ